ncbi:MAG: four helix bundle protein [Clostridiales bacterium]|jgi:four helix bundle protein|nr:four helix bundle protein [Clostridiales bacterium]
MLKDKENKIVELSMSFAIRVVNLYKFLCDNKKEFVLSKQLLRCGTSIGANVNEAQHGQSIADFGMKMNISLKEANESKYWIELLYKTDYITESEYNSLNNDITEIKKILVAIVKTTFSKRDN